MHTHTYIQRTSRVATSVLSGRLVLAKVQADQKKRIITGSEYSSPPPSQTRFCRKATPLACKRNTLDKKTSLNISFGTRGSIIFELPLYRSSLAYTQRAAARAAFFCAGCMICHLFGIYPRALRGSEPGPRSDASGLYFDSRCAELAGLKVLLSWG